MYDAGADAGGVFGGDIDEFALDFELLGLDAGRDLAVGLGRDADDFGEAEVGFAELFQVLNQGINAGAAEAGVFVAELIPSEMEQFISMSFADAAETVDLRGGAVIGDEAKGLSAAHPRAEFDGFGELHGHVRIRKASSKSVRY